MFVRSALGDWGRVLGFVVVSAWAAPAAAQVTQTDAAHTPLPRPVSTAEADLVNNSWGWNGATMVNRDPSGANLNPAIRYSDFYAPPAYPQFVTGDAITLNGVFKWRHEAIDPARDAKTSPGYFSAKCGVTGTLVLRGGGCQPQFGWYNVTDPTSKTPPAANEIYPFITGKPQDQFQCVELDGKTRKTDGFCPLAWDNRGPYDLSIQRWIPKDFTSGDISKDPRYKGGYVGFAMIGDANRCPGNKFSMYEHNERNASGVPWVTTLVYQSTVDSTGFYFAFEDQQMSAADWKKTPAGGDGADGDFNDLVFYVSGLTCARGNQPCSTGQFGVCSVGRTGCAPEGQTPTCRAVQQPSMETCDNVDNDCNGMVDDGDGLCPSSTPICFQGACVGSCKTGEFPCPLGLTCGADGRCAEPSCAAVSCQPGMACRKGACVDPCAGVLCPYGSQCELGQCVDPCAGVNCAADRVCEKGACVAKCDCRGCDNGLTCSSSGRCVDAACANVACLPGTVCQAGACIDPCSGIVCPNGGVCSQGTCSMPTSSGGGQGGTGPITFPGNSGGSAGKQELEEAGAAGAAEAGSSNAEGGSRDTGNASAGRPATVSGGMHSGGSASAQGGTTAAGGAHSPGAPSEKSSSCSFEVPSRTARNTAPLLGLLLGLSLVQRRRRRVARMSRVTRG